MRAAAATPVRRAVKLATPRSVAAQDRTAANRMGAGREARQTTRPTRERAATPTRLGAAEAAPTRATAVVAAWQESTGGSTHGLPSGLPQPWQPFDGVGARVGPIRHWG
jgi:hypothetical protein